MQEPPQLAPSICQLCGASNPPHVSKCWLCSGRESGNPFASAAPISPDADAAGQSGFSAAEQRNQEVFAVLLVACCVLAILIGIGFARTDPGVLVFYAILVGPAFLVTGLRAAYDASQRRTPLPSRLLFTLLWSGITTVLVLFLLVVACVIGLFIFCVSQLRFGG